MSTTLEPSSAPTRVPIATAEPTPTIHALEPDGYPEWLIGRPFVMVEAEEGRKAIGRIGLPQRLHLDKGDVVVGIDGDRVVTAIVHDGPTPISIWSFEAERRLLRVEPLPDLRSAYHGQNAGDELVVAAGANGVAAISTVDGSTRWLVEPGVDGPDDRGLVVIVSESQQQFAVAACGFGIESAYDCDPFEIRRVVDGSIVARVDTHGRPVIALTDEWLLTSLFPDTVMLARDGEELWSSRALGSEVLLWYLEVVGPRQLLASGQGIDGDERFKLASIDALTGAFEIEYDPGEDSPWSYWRDLSNDRFIAIGPGHGFADHCDLLSGDGCGTDPRELHSDLLDLKTGAVIEDAIHINLQP